MLAEPNLKKPNTLNQMLCLISLDHAKARQTHLRKWYSRWHCILLQVIALSKSESWNTHKNYSGIALLIRM